MQINVARKVAILPISASMYAGSYFAHFYLGGEL